MGASGSQPAHIVELSLERPEGVSKSLNLSARLHTAAHGAVRCQGWYEPHALHLFADDIITVSLRIRQGPDHPGCADWAELYLPWSKLQELLQGRDEAVLDLGINPADRRLGEDAQLSQYEAAFHKARELVSGTAAGPPDSPRQVPVSSHSQWWSEASGTRPVVKVEDVPKIRCRLKVAASNGGKKEVTPPSEEVRPSKPPAAPATERAEEISPRQPRSEELSAEDMRLLFQLQVRNRELQNELGLKKEGLPQVNTQTERFIEQLKQALVESQNLIVEVQSLEKELAVMGASLTQEQMIVVINKAPLPCDLGDRVEDADPERRSTETIEAVQQVTRQTIELSSRYDQEIRTLEMELKKALDSRPEAESQALAPAWMLQQLKVMEGDCNMLEQQIDEAAKKQQEVDRRSAQRLRLEHEVQLQEIGNLKDILRRNQEDKPTPPGTEILEQEVDQLHHELAELQRRGTQEQVQAEQKSEELRWEMRSLEDRLARATEERKAVEEEVEELKSAHSSRAKASLELKQLQEIKEFLAKEHARSECRINVLDEKIESLNKEAEDIRQRASVVMRAVPDAPSGPEVSVLQDNVQRYQKKVQEIRREETRLAKEQDEARKELEAAQVEASVLEHKMKLLQSRALPAQA